MTAAVVQYDGGDGMKVVVLQYDGSGGTI